jgi:spoIIIJ-associated protein
VEPADTSEGADEAERPERVAADPIGRSAVNGSTIEDVHPDEGSNAVSDEVNEEAAAREVASAEAFLHGLIDAFGVEGSIATVVNDDESREVRVTGSDLGLLVGPKGGTLEAVQELTRLASRRDTPGRSELRLRVDVGGYRERRRDALARFARKIAEDVVSSGVPKVLEPMTSPDRKIVHDALTDVDGVGTLSEGEEPRRRVVIVPEP